MASKGTAVITGAAQGIGREIALRLAADGFDIALNDIASKGIQLKAVEEEIAALGRKAACFSADVAEDDEVMKMVDEIVARFGSIDVMVANAGICRGAPFLDVTVEDWDLIFQINVRGVFLCYQYAAKQMVLQGRGGRIIGASSLAGKQGAPRLSTYSASKFAVRGLTQSAALELGVHGITVNAYAPGILESPLTVEIAQRAGVDPQVIYDRHVARTALGKIGQLTDVAALVSFLASAESSFITGEL
ncbi:NAD-binding protein [Mycena rebaudengoi]|nr:NAD-binding protein [Mycena rebaudengoi]